MNFFSASDIGDGLRVLTGKLIANIGAGLKLNPITKAVELDIAALPAPSLPVKQAILNVTLTGAPIEQEATATINVVYNDTGITFPASLTRPADSGSFSAIMSGMTQGILDKLVIISGKQSGFVGNVGEPINLAFLSKIMFIGGPFAFNVMCENGNTTWGGTISLHILYVP